MQPLPLDKAPPPSGVAPTTSGQPSGDIHPVTVAAMRHILETNPYGDTRQGRRQWLREVHDAAVAVLKNK